MKNTLVISLRTTLLTLLLTGLVYPLLVTGLAQVIFPRQANGSLARDETGRVVGSEMIAQAFASPAYMQPRPSAAGAGGYAAAFSSGSNLGPTSSRLRARIAGEIARLRGANPGQSEIPADLVTASASGLDPHVSPEAAFWQVPRIAAARRVAPARVRGVVEANIERRPLGILGEARVNVLLLNLALDRQFGRPRSMP